MDPAADTRIAELVCSRICHDLVSPIGAINNGIELVQEFGDDAMQDALELIEGSARKAANSLRFFRMAYGTAGFRSIETLAEARELTEALLEGGKITLEWPATDATPETLADGWGRLLLNMVALIAEGLPRGGTVGVSVTGAADRCVCTVTAIGTGAGLSDEIMAGFSPSIAVEELTPRSVPAYFAVRLAERQGTRIDLASSPDRLEMTTVPVAGT
jgi:histidine phosphotransferase ChpT